MAGETTLTIIGNLTADPEMRFTQTGKAVANGTVASTPRTFDRQSGEWRDGDALFMRFTAWGKDAENLVESASRGTRVIVVGRLQQRSFETREGDKRTVVEMQADEVAISTKFRQVRAVDDRSGGGQYERPSQQQRRDDGEQWASQQRRQQRDGYSDPAGAPAGSYDDPWGSAPPPSGARAGGDPYDSEPPF